MKNKEIVVGQIWNKEKIEGIKEAILEHKSNSIWNSFEMYLMVLGEGSTDYSYRPEILIKHLPYFRECWEKHISCYYALEMFSFNLDDKIETNE